MAKRQMGDLDEAVFLRAHEEIDVAGAAQSLSSVKPEKVTTRQSRARAAFTALRMFGERPELLIAISRSPARAWNSICLAKTFS